MTAFEHDWSPDSAAAPPANSLEARVHSIVQELLEAVREERGAAARAATLAAEEAASRQLASELERTRAEAAEELSAEVARVRAEAARQVEEEIARTRAEDQQALAAEVARVRAEDAAALEQELAGATASAREEADRVHAEALIVARAEERQSSFAVLERLLAYMKRLEQAASLTDVLDELAGAASEEATRVAILLVQGAYVRVWRVVGFGARTTETGSADIFEAGGLVGQAVLSKAPCVLPDEGADNQSGLPFAGPLGDRAAVAVPLIVGERVVGVIYGDDLGGAGRSVPAAWPETIEVLARHASRCLEFITVSRVTARAAEGRRTAIAAGPGRSAARSGGELRWAEDSARRIARELVADVKQLNAPAVQAGCEHRDLLNRLRPEIEEARRLYEEQVPQAIPARRRFFDQEVLRTLANGDPRLLGY